MIKEDIMTKVAKDTMISRGAVEDVINSFLNNIEEALINNDRVVIRGFGTFKTVERKEKVGRNIKAGIPIKIPAHIAPVFEVSDSLKQKVYREIQT